MHSGLSTPIVDLANEPTSRARLVVAAVAAAAAAAAAVASMATTPMPTTQQWQQELQAAVNQIGYYHDAPTPFHPPMAIPPSSAVGTEASTPAAVAHLMDENRSLSMRVLALEARVNILYIVLERIVNQQHEHPDAQP
ncbi:hypothetical protein D0Z00_000197 [Geotrichum galactomycetum]|uniref:Uncharacterized protein n=1 Tax=Geotrichum galactomycetum TaxID=27317 RepID=A0ACB6VAQ1_9ASCO|nr:hypothetical protein D0Z00_000197 [Geotrichum candidum]